MPKNTIQIRATLFAIDQIQLNRNPHIINGGGKISQETRFRTGEMSIWGASSRVFTGNGGFLSNIFSHD